MVEMAGHATHKRCDFDAVVRLLFSTAVLMVVVLVPAWLWYPA